MCCGRQLWLFYPNGITLLTLLFESLGCISLFGKLLRCCCDFCFALPKSDSLRVASRSVGSPLPPDLGAPPLHPLPAPLSQRCHPAPQFLSAAVFFTLRAPKLTGPPASSDPRAIPHSPLYLRLSCTSCTLELNSFWPSVSYNLTFRSDSHRSIFSGGQELQRMFPLPSSRTLSLPPSI